MEAEVSSDGAVHKEHVVQRLVVAVAASQAVDQVAKPGKSLSLTSRVVTNSAEMLEEHVV
jgi:hypothetical protein